MSSSGSFSGPDPADTDGDDGDSEPLTEKYDAIPDGDTDGDLAVVDAEATCENCSHRGVCSIYNNFAQQMEQSFGANSPGADDAPVDPERLAWHCEMYDPTDTE